MTDLPGYPSRRSFLKASAASVMLSGLAVSAKAEPQTPRFHSKNMNVNISMKSNGLSFSPQRQD